MSLPTKFITLITQKIPATYEAGKQDEHIRFMDIYQDYGNRQTYNNAFNYWDERIFYPTCDIKPKTASSIFQGFNSLNSNGTVMNLIERLNECGKSLDFSNTTGVLSYIFNNAKISHIPLCDFHNAGNLNASFSRCSVEYIEKIIVDEGNTYQNSFDYCENLTEVRFGGVIASSISFKDSPLLTSDSVWSIINALKTLVSTDSAQTLTLHSTVKGNLTTEQEAEIYNKGWTLA